MPRGFKLVFEVCALVLLGAILGYWVGLDLFPAASSHGTLRMVAMWLGPVALILAGVVAWRIISAFHPAPGREMERRVEELKQRHAEAVREKQFLAGDLETARAIQRMFLPDPVRSPFPQRLAFAHVFLPEMAVGGDYYDLKQLDDRRVALLMADVSGHGMSAAFVTGLIKTTFEFSYPPDQSPREFMARLNNVLERLTPPSSFAAVVFAVYDVASRELRYSNAGHNPAPILVRGSTGEVEWLDDCVDLLAGVNPDMKYQEDRLPLSPGDKFVVCTDGITDIPNAEGERFGFHRLYDCLRENAERPAGKLLEATVAAVTAHAKGLSRTDDQTILIMEVLK
jgi:sigma-B regulation protein RsbU (phosphoserine phosphatase)